MQTKYATPLKKSIILKELLSPVYASPSALSPPSPPRQPSPPPQASVRSKGRSEDAVRLGVRGVGKRVRGAVGPVGSPWAAAV